MPFSVYLLALTIFALGTSEFMIAGMMPSLTSALGITVAQGGNLISLYAAGMVVGGPLVTAVLLRLRVSDKRALLTLLLLYAAAQSVAAMSQNYAVLASARIVTGVVGAACFGLALTICATCVAPETRGRAASIVLGGLMLATVPSVPLATLIDQHWGWRASFWMIVVLTLACTWTLAVWTTAIPSQTYANLSHALRELRNRHLWAAYLTCALVIGATFAAFSYLAVILTDLSGWSRQAVPWLLAGYGLANLIGNTVVGRYADRHTYGVQVLGLVVMIAALTLFALQTESAAVSVSMVLTLGLTGITLNPAMAARVMQAATPGPLVNTVHASIINIGLGIGTSLGGLAIQQGYGLRAPLWLGIALAVLGILSLLPYVTRIGSSAPC
ncbi:MFS transporter [Diaphorobacter sp. HDW4A]|uniref:MFS transporter n=1 Tax=Diaphorobacter sp. HDW4A TaxID=2714924 RepID=UPI00140E4FD5|nr:MFS transporter [Diaphorobacter sp. HDW4A]QIL80182.1 MFS transporter [Diaphorobacter sp. HDW4A]